MFIILINLILVTFSVPNYVVWWDIIYCLHLVGELIELCQTIHFHKNIISFVTHRNKHNTDSWKKGFCGSYTRSYRAIILSIILLLFVHFICRFIDRIWTGSGLIFFFYIYCITRRPQKNAKATLHKPMSLLAIRRDIPRHLTKTKAIAIITEVELKASNEMLCQCM